MIANYDHTNLAFNEGLTQKSEVERCLSAYSLVDPRSLCYFTSTTCSAAATTATLAASETLAMATIAAEKPSDTGPATTLSMGHLALHYDPADDGPRTARLLGELGLIETQMLPLPRGNFYRFVVGRGHFARSDGIVYLSALPKPQARLIAAIRAALHLGTGDENPVVAGHRAMMATDFEAGFHFGFLIDSFGELERIVLRLMDLDTNDPELKGRVNIGMNRDRRDNAAVDARLDASPIFGTCDRYAYGSNGVQIFIEIDLIRAGQLGENMVLELDYVFPGSESHILSIVEL